jgi:hypothetical protein
LLPLHLHCEPHLHLHSLANRHIAAESSQTLTFFTVPI